MGKKKEKIEIRLSDEELMPATIGILEEAKSGTVGLIILFLIFTLFAIFLPNITEGINKLLGKDDSVLVNPDEGIVPNPDVEEEVVESMHDLIDDLEITYNDIKFSKFVKSEINGVYYISFSLENMSDNMIDFEKTRYYLETYTTDKTLLSRHIFNNNKLNLKSILTQTLEITEEEYNNVSKVLITKKTKDDYPEISLNENDSKQYSLTCIKNKDNIIYTFDKDKNIIRIKDTINVINDNSTIYSQSLSLYQNQVANLNNKTGISSSLVEISTGFIVSIDISVKSANLKKISNDNYYSEAEPKVIDFEMESRGYSCN